MEADNFMGTDNIKHPQNTDAPEVKFKSPETDNVENTPEVRFNPSETDSVKDTPEVRFNSSETDSVEEAPKTRFNYLGTDSFQEINMPVEDSSSESSSDLSLDSLQYVGGDLNYIGNLGRKGVGMVLSKHLSDRSFRKVLPTSWLQQYNEDPESACKSIYELILHCAGYKSKQALDDAEFLLYYDPISDNFDDVIGDLTQEPLVSNEPYLKDVTNFIVESFSEEVLNDKVFMMKIHAVLQVLNQSKWKAARYTGAMFIFIIARCFGKLVNITPNLSRQYPILQVPDTVSSMFNPFFWTMVVCLIDTHLETRKKSIELYWELLVEFPSLLIHRTLVRNILWAICDENQTIRIFGIRACCDIIQDESIAYCLPKFVNYVFHALTVRIKDISETVAEEAFKAMSVIYKKSPNLFDTHNLEKLLTYIYCGSKRVNSAAGEFLYLTLEHQARNHTVFFKCLTSFLYACECSFQSECGVKLINAIFPFGKNRLTNWKNWSDLLYNVTLEEEFKKRACFLLIVVMENCTTFQGDLCQFFPKEKMSRLKKAEKIELYNQKLFQAAITRHFGQGLIPLWEHFKNKENCMQNLIKISKFCDIDKLDINKIYKYLLSFKFTSESCIEEVYSTLAFLLRSMESSSKWQESVPVVLQGVINDVGRSFSQTCQKITSNPESSANSVRSVTLIKAIKLAKYFDLTLTGFNHHAFEALKLGIDTKNVQVTKGALQMCSSIVQWQVTDVAQGNHPELLLNTRLRTLHGNILKLMPMLAALLLNSNHSVRIQTYFTFCKIYVLFSPLSDFVRRCPMFQWPKPSLVEMEWLNFTLHQFTEQRYTVKDDESFFMTQTALRSFCLLMTTEVLPLMYFPSILPYFSCYKAEKRKNYNYTLQAAFERLLNIDEFPIVLILSLELYIKENTIQETEEIVEGMISVCITKMPTLADIQSLSLSIVGEGVNHIRKVKNFPFFVILSHFARLLAPGDAEYLNSFIMRVSKFPADNEFVIDFVNDLKNRSVPKKIVPAPAEPNDDLFSSDDYY